MPAMASLSKQSLSGKPKLDRRNALPRKLSDYEPPSSPSTAFRTIDKNASFRVVGLDSEGEIEKICEKLGIPGGADAFSIPQEAWEAGKAKAGSLDRFILDHKARSRSLDEPPGSFFGRLEGGEFASSPLVSAQSLGPSPFYNSLSSSSGDSFASDTSLPLGDKGFFGPLDTPREQALSHPSVCEPQVHIAHQQDAKALISSKRPINVDSQQSSYAHQQVPVFTRGQGVTGNVAREPRIHEARLHVCDDSQRADDGQIAYDIQRLSTVDRFTRATTETNQHALLPPPVIRLKPELHLLTAHELLAGFGPDQDTDSNSKQINDDSDTSSSDSEVSEADILENEAEEEFNFVSEVVQQHSDLAKEQTHVDNGANTTPQTPERSASKIVIQSWRKLDLLGSGSFGTVYEGMSEDGIYFAVKEVSLSENDSKAQQCVIQLEQEIEFLSKFHHENIVQYLGTQKGSDKLYIFLELVTKGSLSSLYQKYTLFDSQIRSYTRQILSGLKYLHDRKVMHRDIKCANILVDVSGKIKLADFGLAKQISQLDELKSCKGSAYWMAPEVVDPRKTYSFPADIWSLGCTVLEMATRQLPFGGLEWHRALWKLGHGEAPPIPETLSEEAKDFIKSCLEVNPRKRPSASQLLEHAFVKYAGGTGLTPRSSFTQDTSELPVIAEDKTFSG